jgi:predicted transcriptional regulator
MKNSSKQDQIRHEAFVHRYNAIDSELRRQLRKTRATKFIDLVSEYESRGCAADDAECLRLAAALRNFVVHEPKKPADFCAIPTGQMLDRLAVILDRLQNPERVIPRFARPVDVVAPTDTLQAVLTKIHSRDFSQFPVYAESRFKGLLTENGLTRWLARHVVNKIPLVDLEEVYVDELLHEQEQRDNYQFIDAGLTIKGLRAIFRDSPLVEAALITATGRRTEALQGIATRWDIVAHAEQ